MMTRPNQTHSIPFSLKDLFSLGFIGYVEKKRQKIFLPWIFHYDLLKAWKS